VSDKITEAEGAEVIKPQKWYAAKRLVELLQYSVHQHPRSKRRFKNDPDTCGQQGGVDDSKEQRGNGGADRTGFAEGGWPANADQQTGHQRRQAGNGDQVPWEAEQGIFLSCELEAKGLQEAKARLVGKCVQHRREQIKRQARGTPSEHWRHKPELKEARPFDPDQGHQIGREKADHGVVVGGGNTVNQGRAREPALAVVDSRLEQAPDYVREKQQVEHLAGRGGGVF